MTCCDLHIGGPDICVAGLRCMTCCDLHIGEDCCQKPTHLHEALVTAYTAAGQECVPCLQVTEVQCTFILQMLSYSNFNKHLSAVRETFAILKRASEIGRSDQGQAMQRIDTWLRQRNIVTQLLRANLHQRQYVDQVTKQHVEHKLARCLDHEGACAGSFRNDDLFPAGAGIFAVKPATLSTLICVAMQLPQVLCTAGAKGVKDLGS